jgi:hypothetical protein
MPLQRFLSSVTFRRPQSDSRQLKERLKSNRGAASQLAPTSSGSRVYIADDKLFCVYLATSEHLIRQHAQISGFRRPRSSRSAG